MPPADVYAELIRAVIWFSLGFTLAVLTDPLGLGWWLDGGED